MNTLESIQATLPNLTFDELETLQKAIANLIKEKQEAKFRELRQEIEAMAARLGVPYETLFEKLATEHSGRTHRNNAPKRKIPYIYRHPTDPEKGWTGRGLAPKWLKEWEAQGRSREELRIR